MSVFVTNWADAARGRRRKSSLEPVPMGAVVHGGQGMVVPRLLSAILRRQSESRVRGTVSLSCSRG